MNQAVHDHTDAGLPAVAAVVVLFNSPSTCLQAIETYRDQVQRLYIIDNSPQPTPWVTNELSLDAPIVYRHLPQNEGIATALNVAARLAIADGFCYLLTMDDDSHAPAEMVAQMLDYLATKPAQTIGIVSPRHVLSTAPNKLPDTTSAPVAVLTTMTSGNLVDLRIYERVGPFCDGLFIDVVDHEFDLRLQAAGYRIIELPALHLTHRLGEQKQIPFTGLTYVSHAPARNYYLVRNSFIVAIQNWRCYPFYMGTALLTIGIETVKAALVEDRRLLRLKLIGKALYDGLTRRMGRLNTNIPGKTH